MLRLVVLSLLTVSAAAASGAVIFEPVQYQYGTQSKFYYGGSDGHVIARGLADGNGYCGMNGYGDAAPVRIYNDGMPGLNAAVYGMTTSEARDQANRNVPRYFKKRDLLAAAVCADNHNWVILPQAKPVQGTIVILPSKASSRPVTQPATKQKVFIFPKEMLDRPVVPHTQPVAQAD